MKSMKTIVVAAGIGIALAGVGAATQIGAIQWGGFLSRQVEEQRNKTFKTSTAYRDGMKQELGRMMNEWRKADAAGRIGIEAAIRHQFAEIDTTDFPAYLRDFLRTEIGVY